MDRGRREKKTSTPIPQEVERRETFDRDSDQEVREKNALLPLLETFFSSSSSFFEKTRAQHSLDTFDFKSIFVNLPSISPGFFFSQKKDMAFFCLGLLDRQQQRRTKDGGGEETGKEEIIDMGWRRLPRCGTKLMAESLLARSSTSTSALTVQYSLNTNLTSCTLCHPDQTCPFFLVGNSKNLLNTL